MSKRCKPLSPEQFKLNERADKEMARWGKSLSRRDRAKLRNEGSTWAREGGSIIAPGFRRTKAYRKRERLRLQREARFQAEKAAYEARRA